MINSMSIQHKLYSNINKSVLSHIFDDFEASELFMNLYILIQLSCSSLFFSKLWRRIHNQSTHTLRTVFFFGDRSSTRFCESIPDVFCNERTKRRCGSEFCSLHLCSRHRESQGSSVDSAGHKSATNTAKEG